MLFYHSKQTVYSSSSSVSIGFGVPFGDDNHSMYLNLLLSACNFFSFLVIFFFLCLTSVSYTHLDVYKRQSLYPPKSWLAKRDRLSAGPIPGNNFRPFLDNSPYIPFAGEGATVTNDQLTMFVNATMYRPFGTNVETHQWFQIFENIMGDAGGKPHWAKNFIGIDGDQKTEQDLKTQLDFGGKPFYTMIGFNPVMKDWFGENLVKYNQVRRETDPSGVFLSGKSWAIRNGILLD